MNRKQKILTTFGLVVFGLIVFGHYCDPWINGPHLAFGAGYIWHGRRVSGSINPLIADTQMPLFALFVVYAGLFFLIAGKDKERPPEPPSKVANIILAMIAIALVLTGVIGMIQSNAYQSLFISHSQR